MTKVKAGESDPTQPNDDKIERHTVTISDGGTTTVSYDYNYDNEPIIVFGSDGDSSPSYTSKGPSEVTVQNNDDTQSTIEFIIIGN